MADTKKLSPVYLVTDDPQFIEARARETEIFKEKRNIEQQVGDLTTSIIAARSLLQRTIDARVDIPAKIQGAVAAGATTLDAEEAGVNLAELVEQRRLLRVNLDTATRSLDLQRKFVAEVRVQVGRRIKESARPHFEGAKARIIAGVRELHEAAKAQAAITDSISCQQVSVGDVEQMGGVYPPNARNLDDWTVRKGEVARWLAKYDTETSEG